jgi:hypothetical protein
MSLSATNSEIHRFNKTVENIMCDVAAIGAPTVMS